MDSRKQLVISIINFFKDEMTSNRLGEEANEGLEVAIQCLETAYEVEGADQCDTDVLQVFNAALEKTHPSAIPKTSNKIDDKKQAENLKMEGNNLMKAERFIEAVECYTKAINNDPDNAVYYCNRAAAYTKLNDNRNAIADCEKAIIIDSAYSKAYVRMGLAYLNEKDFAKAVQAYEKAVSMEPDNESYKRNLEVAKEQMKTSQTGPAANQQASPLGGLDLGSLLSNPAVMNLAQNFMQNPQMQNMFANMMGQHSQQSGAEAASTGEPQSTPSSGGFQMPAGLDMGNVMNATQQFAEQMRSENPDLVENLRAQFQQGAQPNQPSDADKKPDGTS